MTYVKPELTLVGTAAQIVLGDLVGSREGGINPPGQNSVGSLVVGLDD